MKLGNRVLYIRSRWESENTDVDMIHVVYDMGGWGKTIMCVCGCCT